MSVTVDCVVSTMLTTGGDVILNYVGRIAANLDIPSHISSPWFRAHRLLGLGTHDLFTNILDNWVVRNEEEAKIGRLTKIMIDMELLEGAESISKLGNPETPIILCSTQRLPTSTSNHAPDPNANSFSFGVKQPIHPFVGRAKILEELNDHFIDQRHKCVVVYGIGGQGKTELCKKFIQILITANSSNPTVVWLPGESIQQLTSKISKLANRLSISTHDDAGNPFLLLNLLENVAKHIKNQFSTPRWLIVVDNIDEMYPEIKKMIQILIDFQAFVLITSRRNDIFPGAATPLKLETLSPSDAMLLVKTSLKNTTDDDATLLCNKIGNHALALQQSLAYIRMQAQISTMGDAYGISHFLQEFQESQKIILQHPVELVNYDHTIHAIVRTTLDSISTKYEKVGQMTRELGIILGLVNPDGIHLNTLHKLYSIYAENRPKPMQYKSYTTQWWLRLFGNGGQTAGHVPPASTYAHSQLTPIRGAVLLLAKFSMVSLNGEVVSTHRLVQMILRLECEYEQTINILLKHIKPKHHSVEELRQVISIWEHADPETVKIYPNFAIRIFFRMSDLSLGLELSGFAEKNHTLLSQLLKPNHEETLLMEYAIVRAMDEKGDYETALTKLKTLHEKMKSALGEEHAYTLNTADLISIVLYRLNRNEEALKWREKELESTVKVHGENHIYTMKSRSNKAAILIDLGRIDEALSINQRVLEWREVNLGSSHPHTLSTRHSIALIRFRQKQFHEARSEFETLLKLKEDVLGDEHVHSLNTKSCLAQTHWELNRREDAIRMMEEGLVSQEKVLGPNHPHTNMTRGILSNWIQKNKEETSLEVN